MTSLDTFIEVKLHQEDDFLKVKETLTRVGVASEKNKTLYQSCHILHKRGKYYIVHFKELFALDGKPSSLDDEDLARRNTIANLLADWGLIELVNPKMSEENQAPMKFIKVIPYKEKHEWELNPGSQLLRNASMLAQRPSAPKQWYSYIHLFIKIFFTILGHKCFFLKPERVRSSEVLIIKRAHALTTAPNFFSPLGHCIRR